MSTTSHRLPSPRASIRILVVEDEPGLNDSLVHALSLEGYDAQGVTTVKEARSHEGFDLALLDLDLVDGSGLTLLKEWREHGLDVPVIVLTGDRSARSIERACSSLDAWDYLGKPFDLECLRDRITDALERAGARREIRARSAAA